MGACGSAEAAIRIPPRLDTVVPRPWERRLDRMLDVPLGAIRAEAAGDGGTRLRVRAAQATAVVSFARYDGSGGLAPVAWAEAAPLCRLHGELRDVPVLAPGLALCGAAFVYDPAPAGRPGGSVFDHERILIVARTGDGDGAGGGAARPQGRARASRWARRAYDGWRSARRYEEPGEDHAEAAARPESTAHRSCQ